MVVMARTPKEDDPPGRARITAFIVEANSPGLTVTTRCHFMGLRALYNGVIRFDRVAVPPENIILAEGKGLKVALSTLNTGRLTLPAACAGLLGRCLHIQRTWAAERVQWGAPVGHHAAVAQRIARTVTDLAITEAITAYTCARVDRHEGDIRLEAAMAKLWGTEAGWRGVDATMQVRGGRGYETAASQQTRGEDPEPVERLFRDARINTIFEGSTEIMHLFIAREALDPHLRIAGDLFLPGTTGSGKMRIVGRVLRFYPAWWLGTWFPRRLAVGDLHPELARVVRRAERGSRRLARQLFASMLRFGPKLEREQLRLARLVNIGTALFGQCAVIARAHAQGLQHPERAAAERAVALAACDQLDREIEQGVAGLRHTRSDRIGYGTARKALAGDLAWME